MRVAPNGALQPAHLAQTIFYAVIASIVQGLFGAPNGHGRLVGHFFGASQGASHHGLLCLKHLRDQAVFQSILST